MPRAKKSTSKPSTPSPTSAPKEIPYDPNESRRSVLALIARNGPVDATRRVAYESLLTDAKRADLGTQTRSAGVIADALAYAIVIDQSFMNHAPAVREHYAPGRFAYMLDRLGALIEATEAQAKQRTGTTASRTTAQERDKDARHGRLLLIRKLERVAGDRAPERDALATARGTTQSPTDLGASILGLATLARDWTTRSDAISKVLCEDAGLTEEVVAQVVATAEALTGASTGATLAGRKRGTDDPQVNLLEGTVLYEMLEAKRSFEAAHKGNPLVQRLVAGQATRNVLGTRRSSKAPVAKEPATGEMV